MNELIELNYLKRYKEKGKYALTKKGYEVINTIGKNGGIKDE